VGELIGRGVFGTGERVAGWSLGVTNQYGLVTGNGSGVIAITIIANVGSGLGSGSVMFNQNGQPEGYISDPRALAAAIVIQASETATLVWSRSVVARDHTRLT